MVSSCVCAPCRRRERVRGRLSLQRVWGSMCQDICPRMLATAAHRTVFFIQYSLACVTLCGGGRRYAAAAAQGDDIAAEALRRLGV